MFTFSGFVWINIISVFFHDNARDIGIDIRENALRSGRVLDSTHQFHFIQSSYEICDETIIGTSYAADASAPVYVVGNMDGKIKIDDVTRLRILFKMINL